jgi:hypothetical protein
MRATLRSSAQKWLRGLATTLLPLVRNEHCGSPVGYVLEVESRSRRNCGRLPAGAVSAIAT